MGHEPDIASVADTVHAKRKRVVKSKPTRTGCQTCRHRRVKCDEARPVCNKCISSGRQCGGYFGVPISREASSRPLLPASSRSPSTASEESLSVTSKTLSFRSRSPRVNSRTPSPTTPLTMLQFAINSNEQGAFEFFQIRMAGPLELMSPAKGWVQQALQLSVASQAVFHGIAALSNANLAMASVDHVTFSALTHPEIYTEALSQYNKAIFALSNLIRDVLNGQAPLQPVLLACLLLMCFEVHAERNSMAIRHHQLGRKIAVKYLSDKEKESSGPSKAPDSVRELANAFEKLRFGSALMEHDQITNMSTGYNASGPTAIAQTPRNNVLVDAWSRLDAIVDSSSQVLRQLYTTAEKHVTSLYGDSIDHVTRYCLATCASKAIELPINCSILSEVRRLLAALDAWNLAFSAHSHHPETARAFALLQVRNFVSYFALATCRDTRETSIDRFENDFVRILDLAEQYLRPWTAARRPVRPRSLFGNGQDDELCMDDGILSALSLIVVKCRTSTTRRRAREMLANANRREGLGSSTIIAQIAGDIARLEEDRAKDLDPNLGEDLLSYQLPEPARFADIAQAAGGDLQRPGCRLACARYLHESDGSIEVVEYWSRGPCFPYSRCAGLCRTGFHFEKSKTEVRYRLFARAQNLEAHAPNAFHET